MKNLVTYLNESEDISKLIDQLQDSDEDDQSNQSNSLSYKGFEIRKFSKSNFGAEKLTKLDDGYPLEIFNSKQNLLNFIK